MHRTVATRIRVRRRRLVEPRLEPARDRARLLRAEPRAPCRRHRSRLQSPKHPLPQLGIGARLRGVHDIQREPGALDLRLEQRPEPARRRDPSLVVTGDAVAIEEGAHRLGGRRRRLSSRGGKKATGRGVGHPASRGAERDRDGEDEGRHGPEPPHPRRPRTSPESTTALTRVGRHQDVPLRTHDLGRLGRPEPFLRRPGDVRAPNCSPSVRRQIDVDQVRD